MTGIFYVLLRNTGVGWDRYRKEAQKVDPGEENSPAAPAVTRTRDLSITTDSGDLTTEPSPLPNCSMSSLCTRLTSVTRPAFRGSLWK